MTHIDLEESFTSTHSSEIVTWPHPTLVKPGQAVLWLELEKMVKRVELHSGDKKELREELEK